MIRDVDVTTPTNILSMRRRRLDTQHIIIIIQRHEEAYGKQNCNFLQSLLLLLLTDKIMG